MEPTAPDGPSCRFPSFRRFGSGLLALCLAGALATPPLAACVDKRNKAGAKAGVWIGIDGDTVMIKVRDFQTFHASSGFCGCGLQDVPSLSSVSGAQVMNAATGEPVTQFTFAPNAKTGTALANKDDDDDAPYFGFSGALTGPVPDGISVDLVFTGTLAPGTSFASLAAELGAAGDAIGFGVVDDSEGNMSNPQVCPPTTIDPIPFGSGAPVVQVRRLEMEGSHRIVVTAQDPEEGLATLRINEAVNVSESLPSFSPGRTRPVAVTFTMEEGQSLASLEVEACNLQERCSILKADVASLKIGGSGAAALKLDGIPGTKKLIKVANGEAGVTVFSLIANGRKFSVRPLAAGQTLTLDASLALKEEDNSVSLTASGKPGSEAMVVMADVQATDR